MPVHEKLYIRASKVKAKYEDTLMGYPNVIGVGVGLRHRRNELTEEVCIVVTVRAKQAPHELDPADMLPSELEGVPVDVFEVGDITAHAE